MALKNLQSLVLRAAVNGRAVTNRDGKVFGMAPRKPAGVLSLPWHPMPGTYPTGTESAE